MSRLAFAWRVWSPWLVLLIIGAAGGASAAESPRELSKRGNDEFAAGRFKEALESYNKAAELAEKSGAASAELLHNRAAAHFKLGETAEARELWVKALALRDAAYEARCRYNLGNCDYAEALAAAQGGDAKKALEHLGRAADQYRDAIKLDAGFSNARANLELTQQLKTMIEQQAQTQPSSQSTQGDKNQKGESQPSSQDPPQQGEGDQQQSQDQQSSSQPSSQQQGEQSEEQDQEQGQQESQSQPSDEPKEPPKPDAEQSQGPDSQPAESQPAQARQAQSQPAAKEEDQQDSDQAKQPLRMSKQEAERLLQMVRDLEKKRREAIQRRERAKQKPVDKDW
ncbi:photosystem I assembly protein Ycf3 [Phycisphaerae bacterium RAS1]|nr:photosystem I assembly protein Ycf3 [Phycisphaerae bacterium RAS1]